MTQKEDIAALKAEVESLKTGVTALVTVHADQEQRLLKLEAQGPSQSTPVDLLLLVDRIEALQKLVDLHESLLVQEANAGELDQKLDAAVQEQPLDEDLDPNEPTP